MTIKCEDIPFFEMDGVNLPKVDERVCLRKNNSALATMGYIASDGYWRSSSGKRIPSHIITGWKYPYWAAN